MSEFLSITEYQLRNLINNRAQFLYLDLRSSDKRATEAPGHELFKDSKPSSLATVLRDVRDAGTPPDGPIVLICENGTKSIAAAEELARNSFINVFVLDGGTRSLRLP